METLLLVKNLTLFKFSKLRRDMAMEFSVKLVLGSFAFSIFWVLAVFPAVPILPIGRTAGSLLSAALMVIFQVISPAQAYASIDISILGLLFGTMVISVYFERAHAFKYLDKLLSWKSRGGKDLICRICLLSAITSPFFTNDTCCMVLTEFVLKTARQHNLPPQPFLLALASSANIGSSATPIGNPQNLVIAFNGDISFWSFIVTIFPAALVGVVVNATFLLCMYWRQLASYDKDDDEDDPDIEETVDDDAASSHRFSPATMSHLTSLNIQESSSRSYSASENTGIHRIQSAALESPVNSCPCSKWKSIFWKSSIYLVAIGMLIALIIGMNMSWTAITAALVLVVFDFEDAQPCLEKNWNP